MKRNVGLGLGPVCIALICKTENTIVTDILKQSFVEIFRVTS